MLCLVELSMKYVYNLKVKHGHYTLNASIYIRCVMLNGAGCNKLCMLGQFTNCLASVNF